MIDIEKLKIEIIERLKPLNLEKIILFGSYAHGNPTEDSDVDLYVVTNDNFIPKDYAQKRKLVGLVSSYISDIRKLVAIDLIVHTKAMNKKMLLIGSSFIEEIINKGQVLYEA